MVKERHIKAALQFLNLTCPQEFKSEKEIEDFYSELESDIKEMKWAIEEAKAAIEKAEILLCDLERLKHQSKVEEYKELNPGKEIF